MLTVTLSNGQACDDARAHGKEVVQMIPCPRDVCHFWQEYNTGINGNPSLRSLEDKSKKWRSYKWGRQNWAWRKYVGDAIDEYIVEETLRGETNATAATENALLRMQGRLTMLLHSKKANRENKMEEDGGRPNAVPWRALADAISKEPGNGRGTRYGGKCGKCNKRHNAKTDNNKCNCDGGPSPSRSAARDIQRSENRNRKRLILEAGMRVE
jgi:hypothetical protein